MKLFLIMALVLVSGARTEDVEYGLCPGSPSSLTIDTLSVQPYPVTLAEGTTVSISVQVTTTEELPAGSTITFDAKKESIINIPIPCLDIPNPNGSGELIPVGSW